MAKKVAKKELTEAELKALPAKVRKAIKSGKLTVKEEKVLRMRYGLAESDDAEMEFRGQDNDLTRVRLAQMEKEILARMRKDGGSRTTGRNFRAAIDLPPNGEGEINRL